MRFLLVPKSVTLNDLERRNGVILRYFSEFGWLPGALRKRSRSLSHLLMSSCYVRYMLSPVRLSVCRLQRSCALLRRFEFSAIFLRHLVPWPSVDIHGKFYGDRPSGTPPPGELNTRGVAKYSDFGPIDGYLGNGARYEVS